MNYSSYSCHSWFVTGVFISIQYECILFCSNKSSFMFARVCFNSFQQVLCFIAASVHFDSCMNCVLNSISTNALFQFCMHEFSVNCCNGFNFNYVECVLINCSEGVFPLQKKDSCHMCSFFSVVCL
jgi:hypothetical protein